MGLLHGLHGPIKQPLVRLFGINVGQRVLGFMAASTDNQQSSSQHGRNKNFSHHFTYLKFCVVCQTLCSVASVASLSRRCVFSLGFPCPKTAFPATSTSTPARTASPIVSGAMPPSISILKFALRAVRINASLRTLSRDEGINFCPPNPGFTDITST